MAETDDIMTRLNYKLRDRFRDGEVLIPADDALLSQLEADLGHPLPRDYRAFVRQYGGASFYDVVFMPSLPDARLDEDDVFSVDHVLGFYSRRGRGWDLLANLRNLKDGLPPGWLPIAASADNRFCLSCGGDDVGSVYCRIPPAFEDEAPVGEVHLLARSFSDFLHGLRLRDE